jgi:hypothetical protein
MRYHRPLVTIAAIAAAALALPDHAGGVKTLDGKKTKALTFSLSSSPQTNDTNLVTDQVPTATPISRPDNIAKCPKTRCLFYSFKFKPAKGVKNGPFSAKISWTIPGQDYDLYVVENGADVGHCGASAGTSETVIIPAPTKGKVYTIVVDEYRALPDTVSGTVTFPTKATIPNTVPALDGAGLPTNCGLS